MNDPLEQASLLAAIDCIEFIRGEGQFRLVRDSEVAAIIQKRFQVMERSRESRRADELQQQKDRLAGVVHPDTEAK